MKRVILMLVVLMLCASVQAAIVTAVDDAIFDDYLPGMVGTGPEGSFTFGQDDAVSLGQTITVGAASIDVTKILLTYEIDTGKDTADTSTASTLTMHIFEVADSYAASIIAPTTTLLTTTFDAPYVGGTDSTLIIDLDSTLTLAADTSYAVWFDTSGTYGNRWEWFRSSSNSPGGGDEYAGGAFYDGGDIKTGGARDASLTLVPEPATMSLLAIGGIALLKRKRS